jgi:hypothetical protein
LASTSTTAGANDADELADVDAQIQTRHRDLVTELLAQTAQLQSWARRHDVGRVGGAHTRTLLSTKSTS